MKKFTLLTFLLAGLTTSGWAQDQPHKVEVGLEVVNYAPLSLGYSSYYNAYSTTKAHWLPGILFRYNLGRFGLRGGASYTASTRQFDTSNCADCLVGKSTGKEARLRVGGQYSPFEKAAWLYIFSDVYYRYYTSSGHFTGGFSGSTNTQVALASHGVGNMTGFGIKIKACQHFYLNPEVYYDMLVAHNNTTTTDWNAHTTSSGRSRTNLYAPAIRLNAVLAF